MAKYYATFTVVVEVEADNEEDAMYYASKEWWESGDVVDSYIEKEEDYYEE